MEIKSKIVKDWFTGADGNTHDIGRVLWAIGVLVFLGCSIYALYAGQKWDAVAYGTGLGVVLAGGGAALGFKSGTEPK